MYNRNECIVWILEQINHYEPTINLSFFVAATLDNKVSKLKEQISDMWRKETVKDI